MPARVSNLSIISFINQRNDVFPLFEVIIVISLTRKAPKLNKPILIEGDGRFNQNKFGFITDIITMSNFSLSDHTSRKRRERQKSTK